MTRRVRAIVLVTVAAAVVVFAVVQDRVTASGAGRYGTLQRAAIAGQAPAVTVDEVMTPAIARSVRQGLSWGGAVLAAGLGLAVAVWRGARGSGRRPRGGGS